MVVRYGTSSEGQSSWHRWLHYTQVLNTCRWCWNWDCSMDWILFAFWLLPSPKSWLQVNPTPAQYVSFCHLSLYLLHKHLPATQPSKVWAY